MKKFWAVILVIAVLSCVAIILAFRTDMPTPDAVEIHYIVNTAMENESAREAAIMQTEFLINVFEDMDNARRNRDNALQILLFLILSSFVIVSISIYLYCEKNILSPFRKIQNFANRIAVGNLDVPLEMDKNNIFGAFTESFDLMREELRTAKENESKANKSKKELIASLVHDINTPVASVKSAIDILRLKSNDENEKKMLDSANKKLEQIDTLITELFHSTLEELQELKVTPHEIQSTEVCRLISQADFEKRVKPFTIPDCIVFADLLRLQQVFDNIIKNSYKYARTDIVINSYIEEEYLFIEIKDFGTGVQEKELPLLTSKYFRGKNTEKTDGYGLGLYLSKYFMEKMAGGLCPENHDKGFMVIIMLRLTGVNMGINCETKKI
ncbi:MAG: HAMP domain-containing histidine kinase [Lachnospiraceae bacterium]|nr:HAMP domain-containing histidine kinase [Lachnospiraceae bacterium]